MRHRYPARLLTRQPAACRRSYSSGLRINADRLNETIHHTCQWGAAHRYGSGPKETGMARLALSDDDAQARRWFAEETQRVGCELTVDNLGNMFARRGGDGGGAGSRSGAAAGKGKGTGTGTGRPMIAMGSHLDTQPRGGRYDGILGVVAAVEVLRTLHENGFKTHHDVGAVNWTNEEGARFPKSMMSSGVWAGKIPLEQAYALQDIFDPSATVLSELQRHGYIGAVACSHSPQDGGHPLSAHFELHIEQGPVLESSSRRIGVVTGGQAYKWFTVSIAGRDAHTGTTPLSARSDPLLAAAKMIASSHAIAKRLGGLASTGVFKIPPQSSTNTIASRVDFTLDVRHPEDSVVEEMERLCVESFARIAHEDGRGVRVGWTLDTDSKATRFDAECVRMVEEAASGLVGRDGWLHITSGAGHDSVNTAARCPTAMIFVPCRDGVSHHPEEYCSPEDCALGAQTLLEAVVGYDKLKAKGL